MANRKQLRILTKEGVEAWNEYRKSHCDTKINLRGANLKKQNLDGADFSEADIRSTNFTGAKLRGANFTGAKCGLQRRWAIPWVIVSLLLLGISAFSLLHLTTLIIQAFVSGWEGQILSILILISVFLFFFMTVNRTKGDFAAGGGFTVAIVGVIGFILASVAGFPVNDFLNYLGVFLGVFAIAGGTAIACSVIFAIVKILGLIFLGVFTLTEVLAVNFLLVTGFTKAFTIIIVVAFTLHGSFIAWFALRQNKESGAAWLLNLGIGFAAIGGTSFRDADLTKANFTGAKLKSTDLRKATLNGVRWYGAKMLERVRPGSSYLQYPQIRQWLIGKGIDKNFDGQELRGVNLQGANLTDGSFIDTDLSEANLQDANLTEAKLDQAKLNRADLKKAILKDGSFIGTDLSEANLSETTLTGACIQDWNINNQTKFDDVICEYIYLKKDNQERIPHDHNRNFKPGEFAKYIEKALNTVNLVFTDGIDWKTFLLSLKELQDKYGKDVGVQAIEKKSDGAFVVRLEVPFDAIKAEVEASFWQQYNPLLEAKDKEIQWLQEQKKFYIEEIENKREEIKQKRLENTELTTIIKTMAEKDNTNYDLRGANFGGGFAGKDYTGDVIHNYASPEKQTLAEAAAEIQKLLEQLKQNNPDATPEQQEAYVNAAIPPTLKERCISALKAGGETAIEEFLDNPYVNVGKAVVKAWLKPE